MKNRDRSPYSFANINFLDRCNLDCFFCLGKDLKQELMPYRSLETNYEELPNLDKFLSMARDNGIKQLYLTGQNTDPLLYRDLGNFIRYLKSEGFYVGIRTNGILARGSMYQINECNTCLGDAVGYTVLALTDDLYSAIVGRERSVPDWENIFRRTRVPFRVSIVVTVQNMMLIMSMIEFIDRYRPNYIQLRKISTDTRQLEMKRHQEAFEFVAESLLALAKIKGIPVTQYESADVIGGLFPNKTPVSLWRTVSTTANSMNYFTNGVISDEYFIVEGYKKYSQKVVQFMSKEALNHKGLVLLFHGGGSVGWQVRDEGAGEEYGAKASFGAGDGPTEALSEVQDTISYLLAGALDVKISELSGQLRAKENRLSFLKHNLAQALATKASLTELSGRKECFDRAALLLCDAYAVGIREADGELVVEQFNEGGDRIAYGTDKRIVKAGRHRAIRQSSGAFEDRPQ